MKSQNMLAPKDVAIELGCSVRTVLKEISRRRLRPVLRINKRIILIPESTLDEYRRERLR